MKKILFLFLLGFMMSACGLFKTASKHREKVKTHSTEKGIRIIYQPGDSIVYIPKIRYKDTTVIVENRNVVLKTTYRNSGINKINCKQKPKKTIENYTKDTDTKIKTADYKSEGVQFKPVYIIYVFVGLALLIVIAIVTSHLIKKI